MRYQILLLFLSIFPLGVAAQRLTCRVDTTLDMSNKVEYHLQNDTTAVISATINNCSIQKEYYYLKDSESCNFIPYFIYKYKDSFIFISGTHQHYRLLTLFHLEGDKVMVNCYENELMLGSSNDESERIFFLYKDKPAVVVVNRKNETFVRLYKKHCSINSQDIKYITVDSNRVIVSLKNNKKKILSFSDFL
ncbi:MAG: hypothetical protein F8N35_01080 [Paludibacter sp.]|nr:hypothetical protein [Paludibacter sp.]